MATSTMVIIGLLLVTAVFLAYLAVKGPNLDQTRGGKLLLFAGLFILPLLTLSGGMSESLHGSTTTEFCMSCHSMEVYGTSMLIDDKEVLPAVHYQNNLVPRETACYTCHTDYGQFGNVKAKINGLRHMYVHYLGTMPETIELYAPYSNDNCMHCHAGARSFEENRQHNTDEQPLADIISGKVSCTASGCHDIGHSTETLHWYDYYEEPRMMDLVAKDGVLQIPEGEEEDFDDLFGDF